MRLINTQRALRYQLSIINYQLKFTIYHSILFFGIFIPLMLLSACQSQPNQIFIEVDGARQALVTEAKTVREALAEAGVELGVLDRVKPDLYVQLEPGLTINVIRVREEIETEREIVPFERQTLVNEALPAGESKIAQLGVNGEAEISIRVIYENDEEVSRTEIARNTVVQPIPEILVIGPQDTLPPVPVEGTIAYLSNGNAWLIRDSSSSRRALTTGGNLDGHVFSLSPNGRQLLYTTELTNTLDLPLNELWLASTTIVGEPPITTGIRGALQAEWSPVISPSLVAYSTAERSASAPGWQANNDLWLFSPPTLPADESPLPEPVQVLPPNTQGLYPWWGTTFAWSPDGSRLAYARADQIGLIDLQAALTAQEESSANFTVEDYTIPLFNFTPLQTFSDWVWVPGLSWSPDGNFIAVTAHGPPLASEPEEESQVFDLWLISSDGTFAARVVEQVGMWANPAWGQAGIAYGQAIDPLQSVNSRYFINVIDKDGSNKRQIFPFREEPGVRLPELAWSPDGEELLFIYNGNVYKTRRDGGLPQQLSVDSQASHPQWAATITQPAVVTSTQAITGDDITAITSGLQITPTIAITVTPAATSTPPTSTPTNTPTLQPTEIITPAEASDTP